MHMLMCTWVCYVHVDELVHMSMQMSMWMSMWMSMCTHEHADVHGDEHAAAGEHV